MKKISTLLSAMLLAPFLCSAQQEAPVSIDPSGTYMFAQKDSCELFLNVYDPAENSAAQADGTARPTILFVFGGGFVSGQKDAPSYQPWFRRLTDDGYRVVSIDYRLGLKGVEKVGIGNIDTIYNAIEMGVEDLFSATRFLCKNAEALGIDPGNIVVCGSSAGAIISLQAEWHICNGDPITGILPAGFRYSGVISYAGAVFSRKGKPSYAKAPSPTIFFHGTADKIVRYNRIWFFKNRFGGANYLVKIFSRNGYNYNVYRYKDAGHEIAAAFLPTYDDLTLFLEENVAKGQKRIVDTLVHDPIMPESSMKTLGDLYN